MVTELKLTIIYIGFFTYGEFGANYGEGGRKESQLLLVRNDASMAYTNKRLEMTSEGSRTHQKVSEYGHKTGKRVVGKLHSSP
jgi:hypothetical protein